MLAADVTLSLASGAAAALALLDLVPRGGFAPSVLGVAIPLAVLRAFTSLHASRLVGVATVWRRRIGFLDVGAALALAAVPPNAKALVVLWTGAVWIACLYAARAIARLDVEETGSEAPTDH